jgi:hypothetical protein
MTGAVASLIHSSVELQVEDELGALQVLGTRHPDLRDRPGLEGPPAVTGQRPGQDAVLGATDARDQARGEAVDDAYADRLDLDGDVTDLDVGCGPS